MATADRVRQLLISPPSSSGSGSRNSNFIGRMLLLLFMMMLIVSPMAASASSSESKSGSDEAAILLLQPRLPAARTLLQAQKSCPLSFENLNYTVITSRCKGPKYPPDICCAAFKDFACPYADQLNDVSNNCANTMFSYINLNGKYPPGLFANECRDSKRGLECTDAQSQSKSSLPHAAAPPLPLLTFLSFLPIPIFTLFLA